MKSKITLLFALALLNGINTTQAQSDTVLNRYREYLIRTAEIKPEKISLWMRSMDAQQQWPDIDYNDTERANWKVSKHLERIVALSLAWADPSSSYYQNKALWKVIRDGLDLWLERRYKNSNWWHNQIGVPQYMRDIIILLGHQLSTETRSQALEVMGQLQVQGSGAGANLIWSADLGFHYGALTGDKKLMRQCRDLIVQEITISTGEGVQPDYSYHQHGNRLQMYQYGRAFLLDNIRLAWQLRGTAMAYPAEKIRILSAFVLKGWQWMARGVNTVPGTMDRSVSRKGELKSADMRLLIPLLGELIPERSAAFKAFARRQDGEGALSGFRYFPYSDFAAYHQEDFSFFLKTISARTLPTESINSENLKGHLLHSGDAYLVGDGQEYFDLMPVWNWEMLPGVTGFKGAARIDRNPYVGSVSYGAGGITVMDYSLMDTTKQKVVTAHKFWAAHKGVVVCLMAGLRSAGVTGKIYTALDQCRWRGPVTINRPGNVMARGIERWEDVSWIHHAGFAYIPLTPATFEVYLQKRTGAWSDINRAQSPLSVTENIFTPVMLHDLPRDKSTGYVLSSCSTPSQAASLAEKPFWKVLRNDGTCQAVRFKDGTIMAAFFTPDSLSLRPNSDLSVNRPCLVIISEGRLYVSDPAQKGGMVTVAWKEKTWNIPLKDDGTTSHVDTR